MSPSVLFLTRKWPPAVGGMETYAAELSGELASRLDLEVMALPGRADGRPPGTLALLRFLVRAAVRLWRRADRWDVVHFGDTVLLPLAWLHARRAPGRGRVLTVYGLDLVYGRRRGWRPWIYRRFSAGIPRLAGSIHRTIAISRHTRTLAEEAGFRAVEVVPLAVRSPSADPASVAVSDGASERIVLLVGRVVRRKGARWFAENVLPLLPPDVVLEVVGAGWDPDEVDALRRAPRTRYLGRLEPEALEAAYRRCHCVVVPNIAVAGDVEGFGLTAVEATVRGLPTLVSDLEGLRDAIVPGVTGFLVPSGDPEAWRGRTLEILEWSVEERRRHARGASSATAERFSWERVARETRAAYEEAIRASDGGREGARDGGPTRA